MHPFSSLYYHYILGINLLVGDLGSRGIQKDLNPSSPENPQKIL